MKSLYYKMINTLRVSILLFLILFVNIQNIVCQPEESNILISRFSSVSPELSIHKVLIDDNNTFWLASNKGLIETNAQGSKFVTHFESTSFVYLTSDMKDNIWASSSNTIYNQKSKNSYPLGVNGIMISSLAYHEGSLWIGTNKGLYQMIASTGKFKVHDTQNSKLKSDIINFVYADKNKILWVGTNNGYLRIDGSKWELQDKNLKMYNTSENEEGQWIISEKDMFLINKYNRLFPVNLDKSQYSGKINDFVIDSKGRIYIASDILARYDPYNETVENYSSGASILSKTALSLACDKNDNIWIGTANAGFYKLIFGELLNENLSAICLIEKPILCLGNRNASIKVSVSGGKSPFKYEWNITGNKSDMIEGVGVGSYIVTVTDALQNSVQAEINLSDPEMINIELQNAERISKAGFSDGSLRINVTGGLSPYSFNWSNGQRNQNILKLTSGFYTVTVSDKNNCSSTSTFIVKREKFVADAEKNNMVAGSKLRINDLNFEADSSFIGVENYEILEEVYLFLFENPNFVVEIGGHTNTIPSHEYCDQLSEARAKNVAEFLFQRGIPKDRISFKGYGKREPLTTSTSIQGRQQNQRVEVKILKL